MRQYAQAEPLLLQALAFAPRHEVALGYLANTTLMLQQLDKADTHSALLVRTYPKTARNWLLRARIKYLQGDDPQVVAALDSYLKRVDRADPRWKGDIAYAEALSKRLRAPPN